MRSRISKVTENVPRWAWLFLASAGVSGVAAYYDGNKSSLSMVFAYLRTKEKITRISQCEATLHNSKNSRSLSDPGNLEASGLAAKHT